ncbi:MAG: hypothetical protein ACLSG7_02385 [Clostridia bacterium]
MKKHLGKEQGITLIALVITIIILLILAGISISALTNQGLFKNAKAAQNATEKAEAEQGQRLNEYEEELNKYLSNNDKKEEKLIDKVNDGTIKIGDYVKYTPDTASTTEILQELNTYSGSNANTTSTLTQEKLNWRVLDVKDGQVRLISELPTTSKITLSGYNGYNNAVKLLDDTCSTLYSNSKLASKVQNLKIEDITVYMKTQPTEDTTEYKPTNINYPKILEQEENQTVENSVTNNKLRVSEQHDFVTTGKATSATSTLKKTYWNKSMTSEDFKDSKYYELLINNGSNYATYWMSSRCVNAFSSRADFNVRNVYSGFVDAHGLFDSNDREYSCGCAFRPVITLNSNVQIDTANSGNGKTAEQGYAIK